MVLVVHNQAEEALRTVRSILTTPDPNIEVLLVDDASSDRLSSLAKTITDPRFLYLRKPWKSGLDAARQLGEVQASGRVVFVPLSGKG